MKKEQLRSVRKVRAVMKLGSCDWGPKTWHYVSQVIAPGIDTVQLQLQRQTSQPNPTAQPHNPTKTSGNFNLQFMGSASFNR
jgi:hypothetical protein